MACILHAYFACKSAEWIELKGYTGRRRLTRGRVCPNKEAKKLFECEVCYQSFGSVSYLIQHKKTLHEFLYTDDDFPVKKPKREKKWECDICYKKFTTKQSVQQHQKKQHDFFFAQ